MVRIFDLHTIASLTASLRKSFEMHVLRAMLASCAVMDGCGSWAAVVGGGGARDVRDHPRVGHEQMDRSHERLEVDHEQRHVAGGRCWCDRRLWGMKHERRDVAVQSEVQSSTVVAGSWRGVERWRAGVVCRGGMGAGAVVAVWCRLASCRGRESGRDA
jgi:hypothetical protein